ncbi:MAG: hypothetical protein IIZ35_03320 [Clostridia bacterium]|nr:hypothetical protein [Clostridia bacterium]
MPTKATIRQARYDANHRVPLNMQLSLKNDADIIEHLKTKRNKQGYIKKLIRADMVREEMRAEMNAKGQD